MCHRIEEYFDRMRRRENKCVMTKSIAYRFLSLCDCRIIERMIELGHLEEDLATVKMHREYSKDIELTDKSTYLCLLSEYALTGKYSMGENTPCSRRKGQRSNGKATCTRETINSYDPPKYGGHPLCGIQGIPCAASVAIPSADYGNLSIRML